MSSGASISTAATMASHRTNASHRTQSSSSTILRGSLFKLMDAVIRGDRRVKWTHILHYLDNNTYMDHERGKRVQLPFESPLPSFCMPTKELAKELAPCPKSGDSLLRRAVLGGAPQRIVACLCHLSPTSLTIQDTKGRVLLHLATRVPVTSASQSILALVLQAQPLSLLVRDVCGRTPLHWLMWYHCTERTPDIVQDFCQTLPKVEFLNLPSNLADVVVQDRNFALPALPRPNNKENNNKIPYVAAILPDAVFGCLPLHYAVANGASTNVIQVLLQAFPLSKHVTDRYGRTAAHWYLNAGQVVFGSPLSTTIEEGSSTRPEKPLHISGEPQNPHAKPWYKEPLDREKLQMVLSSRVARTMDGMGRNTLHWACLTLAYAIFYSTPVKVAVDKEKVDGVTMPHMQAVQPFLPILQLLMDAHTNQILGTDQEDQTPLVVLLDTLRELQVDCNLPPANPVSGGLMDPAVPTSRICLELSPPLLRMLMEHPDGASEETRRKYPRKQQLFPAAMEDSKGRLPLHVAVSMGCGIQTLSTLVQAHPTGLVHATDTYQSPLHMALCSAQVAPYWTPAAMQILLQTYNAAGSSMVVDGRMALKMEDANGVYPIHYATQNNAALRVLECMLQSYPAIALQVRHDTQDLAMFHTMPSQIPPEQSTENENARKKEIEDNRMQTLLQPQDASPDDAKVLKESMSLVRQKIQLFLPILLQEQKGASNSASMILQRTDSRHHMHVLHVAVLFQAASYKQLMKLLKLCPDSAKHICNCLQPLPSEQTENATPLPEWTVLDLHEAVQPHWPANKMEEWHHIRQLLFAHYPDVTSHRHRHELLSQCVQIVVREATYRPRSTADEFRPDDDLTVASSFHWHTMKEVEEENVVPPDLEISHSLSAVEYAERKRLNIRQPPLPSKPRMVRPPGTQRRPPKHQPPSSQRKGGILAAVKEMTRKSSKKENKASKSKYDEDDTDLGYDVVSGGEEDDESDEDDGSFSNGNNSRDDEGSYSDSEGSYSTEGYSDTEEYPDRGLFTDSYSSNNPSQTFSSELDSREWSPRSSKSMETATSSFSRRYGDSSKEQLEPDAFDRALGDGIGNSESMEEKKDDNVSPLSRPSKSFSSYRSHKNSKASRGEELLFAQRPSYLSEVGMRIWTFFTLWGDVNNPSDNYVAQISAIFGEIPFSKVEQLVQLRLPSYATDYLPFGDIFLDDGEPQSFRDASSPKCRELIHKTCFFVGTYEFTVEVESKPGKKSSPQSDGTSAEPSLIFCRPDDRHSFAIRAVEWKFTTQEATSAAITPGLSEEEIWQTGMAPADMGATFRTRRKQVAFSFTQDSVEHGNELDARSAFPQDQEEVSVLLAHFNATNQERQIDRIYRTGIYDERFNKLSVGRDRVFLLHEYPYALVHNDTETLENVLSAFGSLESSDEMKLVCTHVGTSLQFIHSHGVVHGNVSMRNIVQEDIYNAAAKHWTLRNFSYGCKSGSTRLGRISPSGKPLFATSTLPPEMFVQLSAVELHAYERYWTFVEKRFGIKVEKSAIEPVVDPDTGDTFVVRCHYMLPSSTDSSVAIPPLPYELVTASPATDYWAFGLLIFEMCAGRPLFPTEPLRGRLLEYHRHAKWSNKVAASLIYSIVKNPIHQDLFLQLLSPISRRIGLTVDILSHPFFQGEAAQTTNTVKAMIETRHRDTVAHQRVLQKKLLEKSEKEWLESRSIKLDCWDFGLLKTFQTSPSSIAKQMMHRKDQAYSFPNSILVLPYRLKQNSEAQLVPENIEKAVATGEKLFDLCRTCFFASELVKAIDVLRSEGTNRSISLSDLFKNITVSHDDFSDETKKCVELASQHVESFRDDPHFMVQKLVRGALEDYVGLFAECQACLFLVDEFTGLPLLGGCWILDSEHQNEVIQRSILSSYMVCRWAWTTKNRLIGVKNLLSEGTFELPAQWTKASRGLESNDPNILVSEMSILQDALSNMGQTRHSWDIDSTYLRELLCQMDPKRQLGGLCRVLVSSSIGFWTTQPNARTLQSQCQTFTLQDAIKKYASSEQK